VYSLKEGVKSLRVNGFMSFASVLVITCCLLLTGVSFLISENIKFALKIIEIQNSITIYLKFNAVPKDVQDKINLISNISSCNFYSKEEAIKEYEEILGKKITTFFEDEGNPLPDAFHVSMANISDYDSTILELKKIDGVDMISDRSETAKKLSDIKKLTAIISLWVIFSFAAISLIIVSNTIRITVHNRRFEINIMKSIGATNGFIRFPFIVEGMIIGLISASISIFTLKFVYDKIFEIINNIIPLSIIPFERFSNDMAIVFAVSGLILGIIGSIFSIGGYLKKEGAGAVIWQ
jgi:cell division transport system permease protein